MIKVLAPAKINLCLQVCGKTSEGLHQLDSVVVFSQFGDYVTIKPDSNDSFCVAGPFASELSCTTNTNLLVKARDAYRAAGGQLGPAAIQLDKNIPIAAGLGGGSADAAALLWAANKMSQTQLDSDVLLTIAASLGSDVPVCLASSPQRIIGTGEIVLPIGDINLGWIVLANPLISLSTTSVFHLVVPPYSKANPNITTGDAADICELGNDLLPAAVKLIPEINDLLKMLMAAPSCKAAQMSGSGASCFGIFDTFDSAAQATKNINAAGLWAVTTTLYQKTRT